MLVQDGVVIDDKGVGRKFPWCKFNSHPCRVVESLDKVLDDLGGFEKAAN